MIPTTFSTALPAIPTITMPVKALEIPSASTAGSSAPTNQSETNAAAIPDTASSTIAAWNGNAPCFGSTSAASDVLSERR